MVSNHRVVGVCPAGRRRYLEILVPYLLAQRHVFDEFRFWVNTDDEDDIAYLRSLCTSYPDFFHMDTLAELGVDPANDPCGDTRGSKRFRLIRHFFRGCIDLNTVYVRLDDDICWVHPQAIERLVRFRIDHPEPLLVYPAIINNGRTAYIHQCMGHVSLDLSDFGFTLINDFPVWRINPEVGETLHHSFLSKLRAGRVEDLFFHKWVVREYERVNINCVSWMGRDFAKFGGVVAEDPTVEWEEEWWLCERKAQELKRPSLIHGEALVVHFAFHCQREHMESKTNLLTIYRFLSLLDPGETPTFLP